MLTGGRLGALLKLGATNRREQTVALDMLWMVWRLEKPPIC